MLLLETLVLLFASFAGNVDSFTATSRPSTKGVRLSPLSVSSMETTTTASPATETLNELERVAVVTTTSASIRAQEGSNKKVQMALGAVAAASVAGFLMYNHFDSSPVAQTTVTAMFHHMAALPLHAYDAYESALASNPVATKAATSATVYSIGDVVAQYTEQRQLDNQNHFSLDQNRVLRSMIAGGIGHGPLSHVWYHVSEDFFTKVAHLTAWWSFLPKIAVDQTVWGPIWNSLYILMIGFMRRESLEKMTSDVRSTTLPLFLDGLKLWPLAHCVTYGLVPVENRLLWVDLVEILWVSMLATKAASLVPTNKDENKPEIVMER